MEKKKIIEIKDLTKRYPAADVNAVDSISFSVFEGELFAFLGVNGAGKSTLINMLCTLLTKTSGEVELCGYNLDTEGNQIRNSIGVVFQNGVLDGELSVYDNLMLRGLLFDIDKKTLKNRIDNLVERLSMTDFIKRPYAKLSGGQKRKSDIARALVSNPKVLFLDEPTTGLDPQSRLDMWQVISDIRTEFNTTVFLTTHYMEEVNEADRVAIINQGKLLCLDTPEKLKTIYSFDTIKLNVNLEFQKEIQEKLNQEQLSYSFAVDTYTIKVKDALSQIDLISQLKPMLESIEIVKGDMDSVFLNVVNEGSVNE